MRPQDDEVLPLFAEAALPLRKAGQALPSYLRDHRKRLRERFLMGGPEAIPDYEMLELVLFRAIPRRDVKPLARDLLTRFGDFNGVISAPLSRLRDIEGVGEAVITELKIIEGAAHRLARARVLQKPILTSWDALLDYCQTTLAHRQTEAFHVLYLDRKNRLIADEQQGRGTVDHVPVYPREIMKRAIDLEASALILVHNHPSGDPTPSEQDIALTNQIVMVGQALGVTVHDHLVIGKSCQISFRAEGLI